MVSDLPGGSLYKMSARQGVCPLLSNSMKIFITIGLILCEPSDGKSRSNHKSHSCSENNGDARVKSVLIWFHIFGRGKYRTFSSFLFSAQQMSSLKHPVVVFVIWVHLIEFFVDWSAKIIIIFTLQIYQQHAPFVEIEPKVATVVIGPREGLLCHTIGVFIIRPGHF